MAEDWKKIIERQNQINDLQAELDQLAFPKIEAILNHAKILPLKQKVEYLNAKHEEMPDIKLKRNILASLNGAYVQMDEMENGLNEMTTNKSARLAGHKFIDVLMDHIHFTFNDYKKVKEILVDDESGIYAVVIFINDDIIMRGTDVANLEKELKGIVDLEAKVTFKKVDWD